MLLRRLSGPSRELYTRAAQGAGWRSVASPRRRGRVRRISCIPAGPASVLHSPFPWAWFRRELTPEPAQNLPGTQRTNQLPRAAACIMIHRASAGPRFPLRHRSIRLLLECRVMTIAQRSRPLMRLRLSSQLCSNHIPSMWPYELLSACSCIAEK